MILQDSLMGWLSFWWTFLLLGHLSSYRGKTRTPQTDTDLHLVLTKNATSSLLLSLIASSLFENSCIRLFLWFRDDYPLLSLCIRMGISLLLLEVGFYYSHRLFHLPWLWRFHKTHHNFVSPCALSAVYCSVPEMIVVNQLPVMIGPMLTGMKTWEIVAWMAMAAISTLMAHSSVDSFLFGKVKRFKMHDIHHVDFRYNYGFLIFLDWVHGTYKRP